MSRRITMPKSKLQSILVGSEQITENSCLADKTICPCLKISCSAKCFLAKFFLPVCPSIFSVISCPQKVQDPNFYQIFRLTWTHFQIYRSGLFDCCDTLSDFLLGTITAPCLAAWVAEVSGENGFCTLFQCLCYPLGLCYLRTVTRDKKVIYVSGPEQFCLIVSRGAIFHFFITQGRGGGWYF